MQLTPRKNHKSVRKATLLEMLAKLPQKEQIEIYRRLGQWLKNTMPKPHVEKFSEQQEADFLKTEFGKYIMEEADASISIEKVREALSTIKGNWAQDIIADREERY